MFPSIKVEKEGVESEEKGRATPSPAWQEGQGGPASQLLEGCPHPSTRPAPPHPHHLRAPGAAAHTQLQDSRVQLATDHLLLERRLIVTGVCQRQWQKTETINGSKDPTEYFLRAVKLPIAFIFNFKV